MKKFILGVIGLASVMIAKPAFAQPNFSIEKDTVKFAIYTSADIHNKVTNISTGGLPISLTWRVIDHNFPKEWQEGTGICDNVTCYIESILGQGTAAPYMPPGNATTTAAFSGMLDFKLQLSTENSTATGTYHLAVEMKDASLTDTMVFLITKFPTSVNKTFKTENEITVYPNPARSEVNVLFDPNAGIKNIAVYNLIGKAVSVYRVQNGSAKLDIDNIPSGIYFMRFVDGNGKVVATRKFTHQ